MARADVPAAAKEEAVPVLEPEQVGSVRDPMEQLTPDGQQPRRQRGVKG